jgi:membrane protease subunit (stomatin/prohibitin family)
VISGKQRRKKVFFFEKQKQKTFARWHTRPISIRAAYANGQMFFGSFFQKRTPFSRLRARARAGSAAQR